MKSYILTIIGATLLSAFAGNLAPDRWRKYVKIITGLVLIICILSPLKSLVSVDWFEDFSVDEYITNGGKTQTELVIEELTEKIEQDVEARLKKEYDMNVTARVEISVNTDGEIDGVKKICVTGAKLTEAVRARLTEVYGTAEVYNE